MSNRRSKSRRRPVTSIMRVTGWANREEFDRMPQGVKNGTATAMQLVNLHHSDKYPLIVACPWKKERRFNFKAYDHYWRN